MMQEIMPQYTTKTTDKQLEIPATVADQCLQFALGQDRDLGPTAATMETTFKTRMDILNN